MSSVESTSSVNSPLTLAVSSLFETSSPETTGVLVSGLIAVSVANAKENAQTNKIPEDKFTVLQGNLTDKVDGKFDVVVANIVADIIIMFCKDVAAFMNEGAVFITSGIIDTREQDVLDAFQKYGFEVIGRHSEKGWVCFECKVK